jgi:hypothetical protein
MVAVVICAYFFSRVTEAKTGAARRALRSIFDRVAPSTAAPSRAPTGS